MPILRIIGDVHGQVTPDDLYGGNTRPYLETIAGAPCSIQVGDMGDRETYDLLREHVDPARHRFFPGNHDHYNRLPPHCLGDFGVFDLGGVSGFFVRGALSSDREKLVRLGQQLGKTLWFEEEELTDAQMAAAEEMYRSCRPTIVLSHDAPTDVAHQVQHHAMRLRGLNPPAAMPPSRTKEFLTRLLEHHAPRLWAFGHHHRDWQRQVGETLFVCVGELSHIDIDEAGNVVLASQER